MIDEVTAAARTVVLFLDELHTVIGAGSWWKAARWTPAACSSQRWPGVTWEVIGATTVEEYRRYIERDPALERRFAPILVTEPSVEDTVAIVRGIPASAMRRTTGSASPTRPLHAAARLSHRYITDRFLPDKAIDLIDRASSRVRMRAGAPSEHTQALNPSAASSSSPEPRTSRLTPRITNAPRPLTRELDQAIVALDHRRRAGPAHPPEVEPADIAEIVARATGIPVAALTEVERHRLLNLEDAPPAAGRRAG